jgi:hypothetical protein
LGFPPLVETVAAPSDGAFMLSLFRPRWRAYALATLLTVAALLARMGLTPLLLDRSKVLIFLLAILGAAGLGGLGPRWNRSTAAFACFDAARHAKARLSREQS